MIIGAIEAGGTKFVWGIGNEKGVIVEQRISIPTTTPDEYIAPQGLGDNAGLTGDIGLVLR
jgi:hypothetical protein